MISRWQLYGVRGWGSTLAEGALCWASESFDFIDVEGFDRPGPARDRLLAINPLARVPTLIAPTGEVMTESAAIVLYLADLHPQSGLAPAAGDPLRPAFLNRLVWFVSTLYPTFTYRDYPERWAPSAADELVANVDSFRQSLWLQMEGELGSGDWVLGDKPSALDLYVAVMVHWRPRPAWFRDHCPRLSAIAARTASMPALAPVMARNF